VDDVLLVFRHGDVQPSAILAAEDVDPTVLADLLVITHRHTWT